ncbi:MAG: Two component system histidine kinase [Gammaproteobacteria bacterium]|nr:Two component system histidine kinase [Gammaproteobacteria bacterium]
MSHDIRTPITGMVGMGQLIYQKTKDPEIKEDAKLLVESTHELLNLLNSILEMTRLEAGEMQQEPRFFSLNKIIEHNVRLLMPIAKDKNIQLKVSLLNELPDFFIGHHLLIDRILLNLLNNAIKFTQKGYVSISASKLKQRDNQVTLQIVVEDTGIGIPEDKCEDIFKNFSRLTPFYEGIYKGYGIGLYAVKKYLDKMNGSINVHSELGKGTKFTITIPLTLSANGSDNLYRNIVNNHQSKITQNKQELTTYTEYTTSTRIEEKPDCSHVRLLVVEDNLPAGMVVQNLLKSLGCVTSLAKTGAEAVKMVSTNQYDLILMDIGLPDFSGIEATKQIRSLPTPCSHVPIIALTGHGNEPERRQEALNSGMQEVLTKPATLPDLENIVKRFAPKKDKVLSSEGKYEKPAAQDTSLTIIDWDGCVQKCSGNVDFTKEVLALFARDLKASQEALAKHYTNRDEAALRAELHRVRGGISYLTLPQLENALQTFHDAVKVNPQGLESLDKQYKAVEQSMEAFGRNGEKMAKKRGSCRCSNKYPL